MPEAPGRCSLGPEARQDVLDRFAQVRGQGTAMFVREARETAWLARAGGLQPQSPRTPRPVLWRAMLFSCHEALHRANTRSTFTRPSPCTPALSARCVAQHHASVAPRA
eukprot:9642514-Alexandrium_andersonii.AAC.1